MNLTSCVFWGFAGTIVLTTLLAASQGLGLTRMSMPYLLGTMITPHRDRAKLAGAAVHVLNGCLFAMVYAAAFYYWGGPTWWRGALVGLAHAAFILTVVMPALPGIHPRMASEEHGPTAGRQLEPPGFLALHYGKATPIVTLVGHVIYGAMMGGLAR